MEEKTKALSTECQRLAESCRFTSTSIYIWLKCLRWTKISFTAVPLILGSLSSWGLLTSSDVDNIRNIVAISAFLAGLLPSIYAALKFDVRLEKYTHAGGKFKNFEYQFRKLATVDALKSFDVFEGEYKSVMQKYEQLINLSLTPPEWCFKRAQKKESAGDYKFDVDTENQSD